MRTMKKNYLSLGLAAMSLLMAGCSTTNESGDLDILDATQIQRYLAHMAILYPIDVERFYE